MLENKRHRILVTGGAGFIGTALIKKLLSMGNEVISLDNYSSGKKENHLGGVKYINASTTKINELFSGETFDVVFHLGEYSRIAPSFYDIENVWESNVFGTFEVLEFCKNKKIKIIYAGSSTKFAEEGTSHSPYSYSKSQSAELVKNYGVWYHLNYAICYFYNTFGEGYDSSKIPGYESVISIFEKQYKNGQPLTICGDGKQTRSFTYVGDIVEGLIKSWHYKSNEEFQLSNPKQYSIIDIAKMFKDDIIYVDSRLGDRKKSMKTNDNAEKLLGWVTTLDVKDWINNIKYDNK